MRGYGQHDQRWRLLRFLVTAGLLLTLGCGPKRIATWDVAGSVRFQDGTPVQFGTVEFYQSQLDLTARGTIQPDGTFQLGTFQDGDGAVAGKHEVIVVQIIMPSTLGSSAQSHGAHADPRYAQFESSTLECVVEPHDQNVCELVLEPARR
jgi:hypothetical protein